MSFLDELDLGKFSKYEKEDTAIINKDMNKTLLFLLFLLSGISSAVAQSDGVRLHYVEPPEDEDVSRFYGVKIQGQIQHKHCTLRMVHCVKGESTVTVLNETPLVLQDTVQFFNFRANPYKRDSVRFAFEPASIPNVKLGMEDTLQDILMETYPETNYTSADRIPIMAFTTGIKTKFMVEGKEQDGIYFCGVRDARKHPSEWYKLFGIQNYVCFEIQLE